MSRSFRRFIITYALLIVFCLCLVIPTYALLYDQYMAQYMEESRAQLRNGLDSFARDVNRLFLFMQAYRGNETNTRVANVRGEPKSMHLWWLEQARAEIQTGLALLGSDNSVAEFGILYPNGMCVTSRRSHTRYDEMYDTFFRCDGMTAVQWEAKLRGITGGKGILGALPYVSLDDGAFSGITLVMRVESQIIFCVMFCDDALARLVPDDLRGDAVVTLHTMDGRLLAQTGQMQDGPFESVTHAIRASGLRAEVAIPAALVNQRMESFRRLVILSVSLLVGAGGVLAVLLAHRGSKPVRKLVATLHELGGVTDDPAGGSEYEQIEQTLRSMDGALSDMRRTMTIQERMVEAGLVERFLHGLTHTPEEISAALRYFEPHQGDYCALMIRATAPPDGRGNTERAAIEKLLRRHIGTRIRLHFSGIDKTVAVLPVGAASFPSPEDYLGPLRAIAAQMRTQYSIQAIFAVSDVFSNLSSLPDACAQARHILRLYTDGLGREVLYRSDLTGTQGFYAMDFTEMQRFYETLSSGSEDGARSLVHSVFENIRRHGYIGEAELEHTLLSFRQAFERVHGELPALNLSPPPAHDDIESLDHTESAIAQYATDVCRQIQSLRGSEETDFAASILAYVNARISDPTLFVASVAEAFSISERRLQTLMRKTAGKSFFDYVETRRMEMAQRLLTDTDMPVADIAASCGFSLPNSFYKAFKRRCGVPPSALREGAGE